MKWRGLRLGRLVDMAHTLLTRSTVMDAPVDQVRALIEDLHAWESWSPWQELDPAMQQTYSGAERGIGAKMAWVVSRR